MGVWFVVGLSILVVCMLIGVWWCIKEMRRQYKESCNPHNWEVGYLVTRGGQKKWIITYNGKQVVNIGYGCQRSCQVGLNWLRQRWDENVDGDQKPTVVRDKP